MNAENKLKPSDWLAIKKILQICSANDLVGLIADLHALSKVNKDFLAVRFLQDGNTLERYKAKIKKYLAPNEPWKNNQQISLREAKKVLSDYQKATHNKIGMIELMVYYVE